MPKKDIPNNVKIVATYSIYSITFLYDVYRSKNTITSFLFNIVVQYNSDTVGLLIIAL